MGIKNAISDKKIITAFLSGVVSLFTIMSVLLMNPEQMRRWLLHHDSIENKVERALSDPNEQIKELLSEIQLLKEKLSVAHSNSDIITNKNDAIDLSGLDVLIFYIDGKAEQAFRMKTLLKNFGARITLEVGNPKNLKSNVVYFSNQKNHGLALSLRNAFDQVTAFEINRVGYLKMEFYEFIFFVK